MTALVITPPDDLVSAADAKTWQPVFAADDDARITPLLQAAQAVLEPPDGEVGRAFGVQTLEYQTASWSACLARPVAGGVGEIRLPFPPLRSVESVIYLDADGAEQTLDPADYDVYGIGTSSGRVRLKTGLTWPTLATGRADAVRVRFEAGYSDDDPQLHPVRQAIVLAASHLRSLGTQDLSLRSREVEGIGTRIWTVSDAAQKIVASTVDHLLQRYRIY